LESIKTAAIHFRNQAVGTLAKRTHAGLLSIAAGAEIFRAGGGRGHFAAPRTVDESALVLHSES
jgi:hypothetical protein